MNIIEFQFYNETKKVLFENENYKIFQETIKKSFFVDDLSNLDIFYYENPDSKEKTKIKDEESYKTFMKLDRSYKYVYITNPEVEKPYEKYSDERISNFELSDSSIVKDIESTFNQIKKLFLQIYDIIWFKISENVKSSNEKVMKINYDEIEEGNISNNILCVFCDQEIKTKFYFKCPECSNLNICQICEYRFKNLNFHEHEFLYVCQGKEKNSDFNYEKETRSFKKEEILDLIKKQKPRIDQDYKVEIVSDLVHNINFSEKLDDLELSVKYKNIGKNKISNSFSFTRITFSQEQWYKDLHQFLLFEKSNVSVPLIDIGETKEIKFKVNIKDKKPGKYYCLMTLKRKNYWIEDTTLVFEININLVVDDY